MNTIFSNQYKNRNDLVNDICSIVYTEGYAVSIAGFKTDQYLKIKYEQAELSNCDKPRFYIPKWATKWDFGMNTLLAVVNSMPKQPKVSSRYPKWDIQ